MSEFRLTFTSRARAELHRCARRWRKHRPLNPGLFEAEAAAALSLISSAPEAGEACPRARARGTRRRLLERTRYHVYYRVDAEAATVVVLSFWHTSRGEGPPL